MPGWTRVEKLGQLNRKEVAQTLSRAIAGLVLFYPEPNHVNAQPNKMYEYMSAGIPVIASNFPMWQQVIESNQCGICVDPMNSQAIKEAIEWLVEHPEDAKRMGKNGRKAVEAKYNWEQESKTLLELYEAIR
jgi:glycosyltransferase involved in cell wall biosynthesis